MSLPEPIVQRYAGVAVVRDDLLPGGTKRRYLDRLFATADEVVYASPAYGGAQLALAYAARAHGKRATIFVAKRKVPHARTLEAHRVGARVIQVPYGYLANVQAKARQYAQDKGAHLLAFGGESPEALEAIAGAARYVWDAYGPFDEVWSAAGSGVLTRGLQAGMPPGVPFVAVSVGRDVGDHAGVARVVPACMPFEKEDGREAPFPSCPNYDRKAWHLCVAQRRAGNVLFWNVAGPSPTQHAPR